MRTRSGSQKRSPGCLRAADVPSSRQFVLACLIGKGVAARLRGRAALDRLPDPPGLQNQYSRQHLAECHEYQGSRPRRGARDAMRKGEPRNLRAATVRAVVSKAKAAAMPRTQSRAATAPAWLMMAPSSRQTRVVRPLRAPSVVPTAASRTIKARSLPRSGRVADS